MQRKVQFIEHNIIEDSKAEAELRHITGSTTVPVVVRNNKYVVGYDPVSIEELLV